MTTVFVSAGDASGESHAAEVVAVLRARHPDWRFLGLGGVRMKEAGVEIVVDQRALAVSGIVEVIGQLARLWRLKRRLLRAFDHSQPDLVLLVDSGGFNLPLARSVRRRGSTPIVYFISPQVWAWRARRLDQIARLAHRIIVLFDFERAFHAEQGVASRWVGHPILDQAVAGPIPEEASRLARVRLGLAEDPVYLGLFPGSRQNEIARNLPIQLAAWERLRRKCARPETIRAVVAVALSQDEAALRALARSAIGRAADEIAFVPGGPDGMDAIDLALCKPGSVTLELMLREKPMVVMAKVHWLTGAIVRWALRVRFVAMPNLLAEDEIVPELLQGDATPERLAAALAPLLPERATHARRDPGKDAISPRSRQIVDLVRMRARLGAPGATARVASILEEALGTART